MKQVLDFLCEILHTEILIHTVLSFHMSLYERSGKRPSFNLLEVEEHDSHEILSLSHIHIPFLGQSLVFGKHSHFFSTDLGIHTSSKGMINPEKHEFSAKNCVCIRRSYIF